jgi:hypothetical protein
MGRSREKDPVQLVENPLALPCLVEFGAFKTSFRNESISMFCLPILEIHPCPQSGAQTLISNSQKCVFVFYA